jgi:hypothetical protein
MICGSESELCRDRENLIRLADEHRGGVCRLGDALNELLALYPVVIETEAMDVTAEWAPFPVTLVAADAALYSASRA